MPAEPIYIDSDEEILEVVERLREIDGHEVPLVLPSRSRLGTRFNVQLLRQYALRLGKQVTLITPDERVKTMARDNGFITYSSLEEYDPHWRATSRAAAGSVPPFLRAPARDRVAAAYAPAARMASVGTIPRERPYTPRPARVVPPPPAAPAPRPAQAGSPASVNWRPRVPSPRQDAAGWSLPPLSLALLRNRLALGGAAVAAVLLLFLLLVLVPSANVTLVAQAKPLSQSANVSFTAASGLAVRTVNVSKQAQQSFTATGTKSTPAKAATGSVTYNNQCPVDLKIHSGQKLDGGGQQFQQQSDLSLKSNSTGRVGVQAVKPGAAGNVAANAINTIEFSGSAQELSSCLTVSNPHALTGGADAKKQAEVSQADLDNAKTKLQDQLQSEIQTALGQQLASGETLSPQIQYQMTNFSPDHQVGDTVGKFSASMALTGVGVFYKAAAVKRALVDNLDSHIPAGYTLTSEGVQTNYQLVSTTPDGRVTFSGQAVGFIAPSLDYAQVRSQLAGHSSDSARKYLDTLPVQSASVSEQPFTLPFLPFLGSRIAIHYVVQPGQAGTT